MSFSFFEQTWVKILGHPKLKNFLALSMVTEGVPKKCGKQEIYFVFLSDNSDRNNISLCNSIQQIFYKSVKLFQEGTVIRIF